MAVTTYGTLQLATFDGDVTLYDDGQSLEADSPVVPRLLGQFALTQLTSGIFSSTLANIPP